MTEWDNFFNSISNEITRLSDEEECPHPFFRGLSDQKYQLLPTLFNPEKNLKNPLHVEKSLYLEFMVVSLYCCKISGHSIQRDHLILHR